MLIETEVHDKWGLLAVVAVAFFGTLNAIIQAFIARKVRVAKEVVEEKVDKKFTETTEKIVDTLGEIYVRVNGNLTRAEEVIAKLTSQLENNGIKPKLTGDEP